MNILTVELEESDGNILFEVKVSANILKMFYQRKGEGRGKPLSSPANFLITYIKY